MTVTDHRPTVEVDVEDWEQTQADLASLRAQVARLRSGATTDPAEVDHLREQNRLLRDAANKAHRAEAENERKARAIAALVAERDTARAELKDAHNRIAGIRETNRRLSVKWAGYAEQARQRQIRADTLQRQLDDANAALIAASEDRLLARTLSRSLDNAITENARLRAELERAHEAIARRPKEQP